GLVALAFDKTGAARQAIDLLAQAVGLCGRRFGCSDLPGERRQGQLLAYEGRDHGSKREGGATSGGRPEQAVRAMMCAVSIAVDRQVAPFVGTIGDLYPRRLNPDCSKIGKQRIEIRFRDQREAYRQPPVLAVRSNDPMVPVKFLGRERGLAIHFENQCLVELALGREWQGHGLSQHIGLAEAEYRGPARRPGQVSHSDRAKCKMPERAFLTTASQIDGDGFDPLPQSADRSNYQCIPRAQRRLAQFLRQEIRKLSAPP